MNEDCRLSKSRHFPEQLGWNGHTQNRLSDLSEASTPFRGERIRLGLDKKSVHPWHIRQEGFDKYDLSLFYA